MSRVSSSGKERAPQGKKWLIRVIVFAVIAAVFGVSLLFEDRINTALGLKPATQESETGSGSSGGVGGGAVGAEMNVHFLNVGQGDSCIVELPDGKNVLIDGADDGYDDEIISYINANIFGDDDRPITYFDYVILTHTDRDHCGSMDEVLEAFPARVFYRPNVLCNYRDYIDPGKNALYGNYSSKDTATYRNVLSAAYACEGVQVMINSWELDPIVPEGIDKGEKGYYSLEFYGPQSASYNDSNDYSPIMVLEYEGERFLLTGDCEKKGEEEFVAAASARQGKFAVFDDNYTVSVIKLGHHGSRTSTSSELVEAVTVPSACPDILIIISCGRENKYGHPHAEKLAQLIDQGFDENNFLRTYEEEYAIVLSVRYDETTGRMRLFHGSAAAGVDPNAGSGNGIEWRYIALSAIALAALLLLILPALSSLPKRKRRK